MRVSTFLDVVPGTGVSVGASTCTLQCACVCSFGSVATAGPKPSWHRRGTSETGRHATVQRERPQLAGSDGSLDPHRASTYMPLDWISRAEDCPVLPATGHGHHPHHRKSRAPRPAGSESKTSFTKSRGAVVSRRQPH